MDSDNYALHGQKLNSMSMTAKGHALCHIDLSLHRFEKQFFHSSHRPLLMGKFGRESLVGLATDLIAVVDFRPQLAFIL